MNQNIPLNNKPLHRSIKKLAVSGSTWTIIGYGASKFTRLAGNLILTRLLFPEAFGIMAIVEMVMHGIQMFSDMGISAGVVRDPRGDEPQFFNTAWTLQVIRGFGLGVVVCILSWPVSIIYHEPLLLYLLPLSGLSAVIQGFNSISVLSLRRHINLKPIIIWEITSQIIGLLVMIALAWWLRSVWALVIGGLLRIIIAMLSSHFLIRNRKPLLFWDRSAIAELIRFGKWIFLSTTLTFIIQQGDRAIIGLLTDTRELGLFTIATVWSRIGIEALLKLNNQVLFPIYADLHNRGVKQLRNHVFQARLCLTALFVPLMLALSLFGQNLINLLYDNRYENAGWMLQFLAVGAIGAIISATSGNILLSVGDSKRYMVLQTGRSFLLITLMTFGVTLAGIKGMVLGVTLSKFCDYPILVWAIRRYNMWMPTFDLCTFSVSFFVLIVGHKLFL